MMMIHTQAMSVSLRLHYAQKVPFNGSLGWAWRGEASANFWSRQDHSPEISAIWEATLEDGCVVDMSATSLVQPWSFPNKL